MSDTDKKIDDMFGMLHEIKPVLLDVREGQKAIDARMRATEARGERHEVKIERLQSDVDGLGRKVRHIADERPPRSETRWGTILELLAVIPEYWHVLLSLSMGVVTVVTLLWRHKP